MCFFGSPCLVGLCCTIAFECSRYRAYTNILILILTGRILRCRHHLHQELKGQNDPDFLAMRAACDMMCSRQWNAACHGGRVTSHWVIYIVAILAILNNFRVHPINPRCFDVLACHFLRNLSIFSSFPYQSPICPSVGYVKGPSWWLIATWMECCHVKLTLPIFNWGKKADCVSVSVFFLGADVPTRVLENHWLYHVVPGPI